MTKPSAIRSASLGADGELQTIIGTGLFDFGDVDGSGDEVRLQHPLGVVFADGLLYVAGITQPQNQRSSTLPPKPAPLCWAAARRWLARWRQAAVRRTGRPEPGQWPASTSPTPTTMSFV
ncbi:MAG: hypothetical protein R3D55_23310 [Chloroflexota bacterium]